MFFFKIQIIQGFLGHISPTMNLKRIQNEDMHILYVKSNKHGDGQELWDFKLVEMMMNVI